MSNVSRFVGIASISAIFFYLLIERVRSFFFSCYWRDRALKAEAQVRDHGLTLREILESKRRQMDTVEADMIQLAQEIDAINLVIDLLYEEESFRKLES